MPIESCFLCGRKCDRGENHRWEGRLVQAYKMFVCRTCYEANWDGWNPMYESKIITHLNQKGIAVPARNANDWLPRLS